MANVEHGDHPPERRRGVIKDRGNHVIHGWISRATEVLRNAITQIAGDDGRVVRQTGGFQPGRYIANGDDTWDYIGDLRQDLVPAISLAHKRFGAKCDGSFDNTTGTDDTQAVRDALEWCAENGYRLFIPRPTKITDEVIAVGHAYAFGPGMGKGGLHQVEVGARCLVFAPEANAIPQSAVDITLKGGLISLDWSNENGAEYTHGGLSTMTRCEFFPAGGVGSRAINIEISHLGAHHSMMLIQGTFEIGIDCNGVDILGACTLDGVNMLGGPDTLYGIRSRGGGAPGTVLRNLIVEGCAGAALRMENADFTLICPHFEANGRLRDEADIELFSIIDGATGPVELKMVGGAFSIPGEAQTGKRIEFKSTHCNVAARDVACADTNYLETNGNELACSIHWDGSLRVEPEDWGGARTYNTPGTIRTGSLQIDQISGRSNDYVAFADPIDGALNFRDGAPAVDLRPRITSGAGGRALSVAINGLNGAYDTVAAIWETRNPGLLWSLNGNRAGEAAKVLFGIGAGGQISVQGQKAVAAGDVTVDLASGTVRIAAGQSSVTVTNNLVSAANSNVHHVMRTREAGTSVEQVVHVNGAFTIYLNRAALAEVSIGWWVQEIYE